MSSASHLIHSSMVISRQSIVLVLRSLDNVLVASALTSFTQSAL